MVDGFDAVGRVLDDYGASSGATDGWKFDSINEEFPGTLLVINPATPRCWLYVTIGLHQFSGKTEDSSGREARPYELTFRLRRGTESEPPKWPIEMIDQLSEYVRTGHLSLQAGDTQDPRTMLGDGPTRMSALVYTEDKELAPVEYEGRRVEFVQIVAVTADEYAAAREGSSRALIERLAAKDPALICDVGRRSIFDAPGGEEIRRAIQETEANKEIMNCRVLEWKAAGKPPKSAQITICSSAIPAFKRVLANYAAEPWVLLLQSEDYSVGFLPADGAPALCADEEYQLLNVDLVWPEGYAALARALSAQPGFYRVPGHEFVKIRVVADDVARPRGQPSGSAQAGAEGFFSLPERWTKNRYDVWRTLGTIQCAIAGGTIAVLAAKPAFGVRATALTFFAALWWCGSGLLLRARQERIAVEHALAATSIALALTAAGGVVPLRSGLAVWNLLAALAFAAAVWIAVSPAAQRAATAAWGLAAGGVLFELLARLDAIQDARAVHSWGTRSAPRVDIAMIILGSALAIAAIHSIRGRQREGRWDLETIRGEGSYPVTIRFAALFTGIIVAVLAMLRRS